MDGDINGHINQQFKVIVTVTTEIEPGLKFWYTICKKSLKDKETWWLLWFEHKYFILWKNLPNSALKQRCTLC